MQQKNSWVSISVILVVFAIGLALPTATVAASQYNVLHRFAGGPDGKLPQNLIFDGAGNLYGITVWGGASGWGTVFMMAPNSDGTWTHTVLYSFTGAADGSNPTTTLIFDGPGNLYGTTAAGGAFGGGTVFKLMPNSDGSWTESVVHSFANATDGLEPEGNLIFDAVGNLYGTTSRGGASGDGTVFKLTQNLDGSWTERLLYSFTGADGRTPLAGLTFDTAGNLYGTTNSGGADMAGTVFKLTPKAGGSWTERVLHNFTGGADGGYPEYVSLLFDGAKTLYGTTFFGGAHLYGVVFNLIANSDGSWTEHLLHTFASQLGADPHALIFDGAGNLYGSTFYGGVADAGSIFKLAPNSNGGWTYQVLHVFQGTTLHPSGGLVLDGAGNLYGTTGSCSRTTLCAGVVFQISP